MGSRSGREEHSGPDVDRRGQRCSGGERDERIDRAQVLLRQLGISGRGWRAPTRRDVGVFRDPHRVEAPLLGRDGQLGDRDRLVGGEHRHAETHRAPCRCGARGCGTRHSVASDTLVDRNRWWVCGAPPLRGGRPTSPVGLRLLDLVGLRRLGRSAAPANGTRTCSPSEPPGLASVQIDDVHRSNPPSVRGRFVAPADGVSDSGAWASVRDVS